MSAKSWLSIFVAAALYLACDLLWLRASNPASATVALQGAGVKISALLLAALVLVAHASVVARCSSIGWKTHTAGTTAGGVILGFALIAAVSAWWYRGQFFHDSSTAGRIPGLLATALVLGAAAGLVAVAVGKIARLPRAVDNTRAGPV
jgi:hypothetical protein